MTHMEWKERGKDGGKKKEKEERRKEMKEEGSEGKTLSSSS